MPLSFKIEERLAGFVAAAAKKGEKVSVIYRELLGPSDIDLNARLDQLHSCLFSKIPGLPEPSRIGDLVVVLRNDLSGHAYVDELETKAMIKPNRVVSKGESVYLHDISHIESVHLGLEVANDSAVVVVRSFLWKRSLFFDFGPILPDAGLRDYPLEQALAQQMLLLFGLPAPQPMFITGQTRIDAMRNAIQELDDLLSAKCDDESKYQELLQRNPWILGASYSEVNRHVKLNDENVPDFTAIRAYDGCNDVIELKQPFLSLFRQDGSFAASFNDSWNQAERYLDFCNQQRTYLLHEKQIKFENPRCLLLLGFNVNSMGIKCIKTKESMNRLISVVTYDQLLDQARHVLKLVGSAGDRVIP